MVDTPARLGHAWRLAHHSRLAPCHSVSRFCPFVSTAPPPARFLESPARLPAPSQCCGPSFFSRAASTFAWVLRLFRHPSDRIQLFCAHVVLSAHRHDHRPCDLNAHSGPLAHERQACFFFGLTASGLSRVRHHHCRSPDHSLQTFEEFGTSTSVRLDRASPCP